MTRKQLSPRTWALVAVLLAVLLANLPYLLAFSYPDPLATQSGIGQPSSGLLPGLAALDPNAGFTAQALAHRAMLDWTHLQVPWWNPYEATGTPLAGEMESAVFFPLSPLTLLANGQLYEHILLELLAGFSTLLLLRRLSVGWVAATVGAVAFALNGTLAWFSHATINPIPFLPMQLLGLEYAYSAALDSRRGGWLLIAIATALSVVAGFPEVAYIDGLMAACWFVWRCTCLPRPVLKAFVAKAMAGAALAGLITAPLLLAFADYLQEGVKGVHAIDQNTLHTVTQLLPQFLMPYVYGPLGPYATSNSGLASVYPDDGGYLTATLVMLALIGLLTKRTGLAKDSHRGLRVLLGLWVLLTFSQMTGYPPLLGRIIAALPGMSEVVFFRYADASLELGVILLATLGVDALLRAPAQRRRQLAVGLATLLLVLVTAIITRHLSHEVGGGKTTRDFFTASAAWAILLVLGLSLAVLERDAYRRSLLVTAIVCADAICMFAVPQFSAPRSFTVDDTPVAFLTRHLGTSRFFTLGPIQPNYGSYYSIASLNINDLPIPKMLDHYIHDRLDQYVTTNVFVGNDGGDRSASVPSPTRELLRNLAGYRHAGVKYVLTPAGQSLPSLGGAFTRVLTSPTTWIYRLSHTQPLYTDSGGSSCRVTAIRA